MSIITKRSVHVVDCQGASTEDHERGSAAAAAVFAAAGLAPEHCDAQATLAAGDEPHDAHAVETWYDAERAAIAACCAGWHRVPEPAHIELA